MSKYKGMPDLQEFLIGEGFKLYPGNLEKDRTWFNLCEWYALLSSIEERLVTAWKAVNF